MTTITNSARVRVLEGTMRMLGCAVGRVRDAYSTQA